MNSFHDSAFIIEDGSLLQYTGSEREITIPDGVKRIASGAFRHSSVITGVTIPASVTRIGSHAFEICTDLTIHAPAGSYA